VPTALPFHGNESTVLAGLSIPSIGVSRADGPVLTSSVMTNTVRQSEMDQGLRQLAGETVTPTETAGGAGGEMQVSAAGTPYAVYTVADGDTASSIANDHGISLASLLSANPDLQDGELISPGQMLIIPSGDGLLVHVLYGQTLSDLADYYGVSIEDILNWPGNQISSPDQVSAEQLVFIPHATAPAPAAAVVAEPTESEEPPVSVVAQPADPGPVSASESEPPVVSSGLVWPVTGPISSYMGPSHPLGIDIDLFGHDGAPIVAATSGTVTFAGGDPCCSYGYHVIIMSESGIETVYGHFSGFNVSAGQHVNQGDVIGYGGCTGYCTGTHLHFEVIDNGVRVDPLSYLP
jgi:murein DD-endopeptidase MepM/ murein hydrolase activator NlpD